MRDPLPLGSVDHGARLKDLFLAAMDLSDEQRSEFVHSRCGEDAELRHGLERLLRAHDRAGEFLSHPADLVEAAAGAVDDPEDDGLTAGQRIGGCELVARIDHGGAGSVWRARQLQPVEREVALKVLRLDDPDAAAELIAERQTLARMQHPGIARMFDAGTTEDGRPWLTMDLVEGEPISRYCTTRNLSLAERLRLFLELCAAVQHAHVKGFVHLDIKPGNVLVTEREGVASPVVIDFGIARAVHGEPGRDAPRAFGTPDYMSPEQATGDGESPDARSDIYSLGILLHELASGRSPSEQPTAIPAELRWIHERATMQLPAERYQAVAALAEDVRRHMARAPVTAGPDTFAYRAHCFARRHRSLVAAMITVLLALGGGAALAAAGWWRASVAESSARADQLLAERASQRARRALDLLDDMWLSTDPSRLQRADYPANRLLADVLRGMPSQLTEEPEIELRLRRTLAGLQRFLGDLDDAEVHAGRAIELARELGDDLQLATALIQGALIATAKGELAVAESRAAEAHGLAIGTESADRLTSQIDFLLADCHQQRGDQARALECANRSLETRLRIGEAAAVAQSLLRIANLHGAVGRVAPAIEAVDRAIALQHELGPDHPDVITAVQHRAFLLQQRGDLEGAEAGFRANLERRLRVFGPHHHEVAWSRIDLAWLLHDRGKDQAAESLLREALPDLRTHFGERHRRVIEARQRLGTVLMTLGQLDAADTELEAAVGELRHATDLGPENLIGALGNLAGLRWRQGREEEAIRLQTEAVDHARSVLPGEHFVLTVGLTNLAFMLERVGREDRALALLREAHEKALGAGREAEARIQRDRLVAMLRKLGRADEAEALAR